MAPLHRCTFFADISLMTGGYQAIVRRRCRRLQLGVSPELRRSASYFAHTVSANVAIATPNLAGVNGKNQEGCAEGADSCTAFRCSCLARPMHDQSGPRARGRGFYVDPLNCTVQDP